jgi:RNA polymerase sigma factor (sigma-70 family)
MLGSKRLLSLASDDRLVDQIRRGNEAAFEVAFERHGAGILAFCRHMLGSREEAEDAVQHTFAAAYKDLQGDGGRRIALKAWLYTIARNRCLSVLRARREHASELHELPTDGLGDQVERRAELRQLLADVRELPEEQRAALLLAEAAGLSHAEVAEVLGCEQGSVKGLVFRARTALIERRDARETPCAEIREQLANLRGGALRRNELRHHLRSCPGCAAYRDKVRRQREMLATALPVAPSLGLKSSVLGAAGVTGSAMGGASAGGLALGSATVAKVALVGVLAGGSVVAGEAAIEQVSQQDAATVAPARNTAPGAAVGPDVAHPPVATRGARGERVSTDRSHGLRGAERRSSRAEGHGDAGSRERPVKPERTNSAGGRSLGQERRAQRPDRIAPERGGGRGVGGQTELRPTAPGKPLTRSRPSPEKKSAPATDTETVAPADDSLLVPETAPAPAPSVSQPEQVTQPE